MKKLLVLNIENNNINSIEMIQNLDAPNLDCIYLHGNPIVTVKSLRKANFPKLTRLYISTYIFKIRHFGQLISFLTSRIEFKPYSKYAKNAPDILMEEIQQ